MSAEARNHGSPDHVSDAPTAKKKAGSAKRGPDATTKKGNRCDHEGAADRRVLPDRRRMLEGGSGKAGSASEVGTGLERRRGPGRRRSDFMRSAEEGEMTNEQFLFLMAIDAFKRVNGKTFPSWTDVLEIIRRLGYRKVQHSQLNIPQAEDWIEPADARAFKQILLTQEQLDDAEEAQQSESDAAGSEAA